MTENGKKTENKGKRKKLLTALIAVAAPIMLAITLAAVAVLGSLLINAAVLINASGRYSPSEGEKYDCILILGAGLRADGSPSDMLADRLDVGADMYFDGYSDVIIVSGDHGRNEYDEVNTMKSYLISLGVPSEDIFMDHAGFSTFDSIVRAKEIFCCDSALIVTQKYHLSRALFIADAKGLDATGADAATRRYYGELKRQVREYLARCKDTAFVMLGAEPEYLGETISVFENDGNITNDKS